MYMKWLSRLQQIYQPNNPLFWLMVILNALSFGLMWIVQNRALNMMGILLIATVALVNAFVGAWLMWRLMQIKPSPTTLKK